MKSLSRLAVLLLAVPAAGAFAAGAADAVAVGDPYVRLIPPGARATAAFMTLTNGSAADVKLVKAESAAAKTVELHTHLNEGGVMKMRQVPAIEIKTKTETALKPGGYHIMMIDPTPMKEGDKVAIKLSFGDGSSKQIEATVRRPEAAPAPMGAAGHQHMAH